MTGHGDTAHDQLARLLWLADNEVSVPDAGFGDTFETEPLRRHYGLMADIIIAAGWLSPDEAAALKAEVLEAAAAFGTMPGMTWPETLRYHAANGWPRDTLADTEEES